MKTLIRYPSGVYLRLILKIIISALWLLCIASAAFSLPVDKLAGPTIGHDPTPATQAVCSGSTVVLSVGTVTGNGTTTVQWQVSASGGAYTNIAEAAPYSGTTTATLTISNITIALNDTRYRVMAKDANGTTFSNAAAVTVNATPPVNSSFTAETFCVGSQVNKSVDFYPHLLYQWQVSADAGGSWTNLSDADGNSGSTSNNFISAPLTLAMDGYLYRYTVRNDTSGCSNTSPVEEQIKVLTHPVFPGDAYPTPKSVAICPGGSTSFADSATGGAAIAYQWEIRSASVSTWTILTDNATYSGSNSKYLQITGFTPTAGNNYQVRLVATYPSSQGCEFGSNLSLLQVRTLPAVTLQPKDTTVCSNSTAGFKVSSSGSAILAYQWQTDNGTNAVTWSNVTGVNSNLATLNLGTVTTSMNGYKYRVIVSNACSPPATSDPKTLTVLTSGGTCSILPLQLQSFSVQKTGSAEAGISWKIDQQYAVKYFSVQRSADGTRFMSIGQVSAETGKTLYGFTDNTPGSGAIYYRLQITGSDDEVVFSPVQKLQFAITGMAQLRPSVTAAASTSIYINLVQQSAVSIYVTDITGAVHSRQTVLLNKGEHQLPLWIGGLGKGVYYVHVSDGKGNTNVLTLAKQ